MKHTMTRITSMILALIMLLSILVVPAAASTTYQDVDENAWYYEAVEYVSSRGWMTGVTAKTFAPNRDVSRALFVTVLARMAGVEVDDTQVVFDDVPAGRYYTGAVAWAAEKGIVLGIGNNKFAPNNNISRQELCTMILRFVNAMEYELEEGEPKTFTDENTIASWAKEGVAKLSAIGLVAGYEDGTFRPKATTTRAHVAQIIMRLDKILQGQAEDPVPMPAQSFNGEAGEDMTVSVEAPEGALPADTNMTVSRVTDEAKLASIAEKINGQVYAAADITFSKDNAELEPEKAVEVQISLDGLENLKNPTVYHMGADDTVEIVSSELVSVNRAANDKALRFYASDFSVYIIGEGTETKLLTVKFQDQNGNVINTQVVNLKRMDKYVQQGRQLIHDPGVPTITATQSFEGWKTTSYSGEGVKTENVDVDDINTYITENYNANSQSGTLVYTAMVYEVRYVVYHDQAGAVLMSQAFHVEDNNGTVSPKNVKINWPYVGFKGGQNFAGWVTEDKVDVAGDYPLYTEDLNNADVSSGGSVYMNGATYQLSSTLQLYPYLNSGNWLVFDTYKDQDADPTSTTFQAPVFYEEGEKTVAPPVPERTGYTFKGWYKEKTFTNRFIFGSPISEKTTVYAKWEPKQTTYTVVFWQQKITDEVDLASEDKTYDFYSSVPRSATTGQSVSIETATSGETADNRLGYNSDTSIGTMGYYFIYNEDNTDTGSVVVKGDGSTVLNVYYDRKVVTYKYYTDSTLTTLWEPSGEYVPATNGEYYYYEDTNAEGYYLISTGPKADYQPAVGDTVYYYETYSASGTWALPSYDDMTKFYTEPKSDGGSHVVSSTADYYYFDEDHTDTWIWDAGSSYTYRYRPLFYRYTVAEPGYYRVGTGPDPDAVGTYNLTGGVGSNTISGLYGAQLGVNDWPNPGDGNVWANDTYNYPLALTEFVPVGTGETTEVKFYLTTDSGNKIHIYYVGQELNGTEYNVSLTDGESNLSTSSTTRSWYPNETIHGYTIYGYRFGTSGSWTPATVESEITLPTSTSGGDLYVAFKRNIHKLSFYSNNAEVTPDDLPSGTDLNAVPYGTELAAFQSVEPENGPEGYYFDGWYADPAFGTEFDFEQAMPDNNVRIYAKWTKIRFRVVCDPTGGEDIENPASVITLPNNQSTTFRIDYGETVEGANFNDAAREGYTLLGWYLDTDPNNDTVFDTPFDFGTPMTDHDGMADMTYVDAEDADRRGNDPWDLSANGNPKQYNDADGEHDDVVGKITIYAKWRQDPDGIIGINVQYLATDKNGKTGKFSDNSTVWDDPNIYADKAKAFGQPASTPDDPTLQFLYWEILDKDKNVVGKAYPGQLWDVDFDYAAEKDLTAQAVYYTYGDPQPEELQRATAVETDSVSPSEPVRATQTYQKVTTLTPGKQYLITYTSGSTAYIMGNTLNSSNYINAVSATVSSNTITGDYHQYLFGVDKNSNGNYQFGNLNTIGYLGLRTTTGSGLSLSAGSSTNTWTLTANNYLSNTATNTSSGYPYIQYNTSGYFRGVDSNNTRNVITFYELQEPEITGETFDVTTDLKVGGKYIIAIGDYAVGNTALNSSSNDHFIKGVRVKANAASVTVPSADVNTAMWQVMSGDAASGYVLKNVGNGTYLGMSSDGQCYLAATTESLASHWTYDNGTDLNNHVEEENNASGSTFFYYLSFAGSFLDFTTATYTGHNVKLYAASKSYTVTFKDGYTNTVIETQTVEEGGSATAPEAPDHEGYVFTGWDTAFDDITADTVVTAQYVSVDELTYTVTFRYMDSEGNWTSASQTVNHGNAATPPTVPTPPAGYTFNSWDKKYTNITSNLTINAVYKQVATKKYVITLRAVYGLKTTEAKTHIYWYANNGTEVNNGAGVRQENNGIEINAPVKIPTPSSFTYQVANRDGEATTVTGLKYEDHAFLGWARIDNTNGADAKAHPELFTQDDCWLIWHEDASMTDGGYYTVNTAKDPDYIPDGGTEGKHEANVAADEMTPYHDMYAVWAGYYYVFHSSTGKIEAIEVSKSKTTNEETQAVTVTTNTANLVDMVPEHYLYGGYYTYYGGVKDVLARADTETNSMRSFKNTAMANAFSVDHNSGTADKLVTVTGAEVYTAANLKTQNQSTGSVRFWTRANAYGYGNQEDAAAGNELVPTVGTVYYLKEVPDDYLPNRLVTVRFTGEHDGEDKGNEPFSDLFLLTAVDDTLYSDVGFLYGTAKDPNKLESYTSFSNAFNVVYKDENGDVQQKSYDAHELNSNLQRGYVAAYRVDVSSVTGEDKAAFILPAWTTLDGYTVSQNQVKFYVNTDNQVVWDTNP